MKKPLSYEGFGSSFLMTGAFVIWFFIRCFHKQPCETLQLYDLYEDPLEENLVPKSELDYEQKEVKNKLSGIINEYTRQGFTAHKNKGRKSYLTETIRNDLKNVMLEPPQKPKYNEKYWGGTIVCRYLK